MSRIKWRSRGRQSRRRLLVVLDHFGDKAISDAGNGEDIALTFLAVAEGFAQKKDVLAEVSLFHETVGPNGLHKFRLFDNPAAVVDQEEQYFKGFRREGQKLRAVHERAFLAVQPKRAKLAEALCLLRHTVIQRTLRIIELILKDIELSLPAGCSHDNTKAAKRTRRAAESITGTRWNAWFARFPEKVKRKRP